MKNEIINIVKELIEKTAEITGEIEIHEEEHKDGTVTTWLKVDVKNPHLFTSREGEAISALNHLVRRIVETKTQVEERGAGMSLLVDINGFQKRRIENLHALAHMMAERARYFKANMEIEPMSSFDRRIIHEFLSDANDIKTESEGTGPTRRVVIKYLGGI
jgi:spoIIIJ-associated protein